MIRFSLIRHNDFRPVKPNRLNSYTIIRSQGVIPEEFFPSRLKTRSRRRREQVSWDLAIGLNTFELEEIQMCYFRKVLLFVNQCNWCNYPDRNPCNWLRCLNWFIYGNKSKSDNVNQGVDLYVSGLNPWTYKYYSSPPLFLIDFQKEKQEKEEGIVRVLWREQV